MGAIRRQRAAGLAVVLTVVCGSLLEALILVLLMRDTALNTDRANESSRLHLLTLRTLNAANAAHDGKPLALLSAAIAQLQRANGSPQLLADARRVLAHPEDSAALSSLQTHAALLSRRYDVTSAYYAAAWESKRRTLRITIGVGSFIVAVSGLLLYALVLVPTQHRVRDLLRELEERSERIAAIFDSSPDPMAMFDVDGRIVLQNGAMERLLGYGESMIGRTFEDIVTPEQHMEVRARFVRAFRKEASEFEMTVRRADGRLVPMLASFTPIVVRGEVVGAAGAAKDLTEIRASEEAVIQSEERFRSIFEEHSDAVVALTHEGIYQHVNAAMERLTGFSKEELVGTSSERLTAAEYLDLARENLRFVLDEGLATHYDSALVCKDGERRETSIDLIPMRVHGRVDSACVIIKDVSELRAVERREALQRDRVRAVSLLSAAHARNAGSQIQETLRFAVTSLAVDACTAVLRENDQWHALYTVGSPLRVGEPYPLDQSYSRHIFGSRDVLTINDTDEQPWKSDVAHNQGWGSMIASTIFVADHAEGIVSFSSRARRHAPFDDADRDFVRIVASLIGSSVERDRRETALSNIAFSDNLTGLPNRARFTEDLHRAIAGAQRHSGSVGVLYVDLDGFKGVNDRYGHEAGDVVLVTIARRLKEVLRGTDVLARLGGDEFVVLQSMYESDEGAMLLGRRLVQAASEPIVTGPQTVQIGASVGIANYPEHAGEAHELLRCADYAMYCAKRSGRGTAVLYRREMELAN